jgi:hypothetical protein
MLEAGYQKKIMNAIEAMGGWAVNGNYTKTGEPDLQCGYPMDVLREDMSGEIAALAHTTILAYIAIEVKTEADYHRVMSALNDNYEIVDIKKLKEHEPLQIHKVNEIRRRGGLALVAWNIEQVKEYVNES